MNDADARMGCAQGKDLILGSTAIKIEVWGGASPTGATGQYLNELVVPAMAQRHRRSG
ncbi:hypothetical protein [Bradyrhizobium sp. CB2312]|uniref:hypothetical protein n=1 Tax=Bradyrhizobium sp. CB2312 TaxID=3039155 RepID=UPI0024B13A6C|nr:hypothetical protein [Bradyrhizobium sp. CB2312]WFU70097.1 hypothetical protein QA642_33155 [Bradyrhizobium sp. CB2312]